MGNHRKYWESIVILNHFCGKFMEKLWQKAPQDYSASFGTNNLSNCLWENSKTPRVHDFRISERFPEPQNQYDLSLETPRYFGKSRTSETVLGNVMFLSVKLLTIGTFENVGWAENPNDPS